MKVYLFLHILVLCLSLSIKQVVANTSYDTDFEDMEQNMFFTSSNIDIHKTIINLQDYDLADTDKDFIEQNYSCRDNKNDFTIQCLPKKTFIDSFLSLFYNEPLPINSTLPEEAKVETFLKQQSSIYELKQAIFKKGWWLVFEVNKEGDYSVDEMKLHLINSLSIIIEF